MATTAPDNLYLSPDQQDLLLAALTSNSSSSPLFNALSHHSLHSKSMSPSSQAYNPQGSPPAPPHTAGLDTEFPHGTPLLGAGLDYNDWDAEFDQDGPWDYDLGADLLHDTSPAPISNGGHEEAGGASSTPARNGESEKRKEPPQGDGTEETDPKRRDDKENKTAKKPGRKPLTSEPTSKRKAQNRAAQRAFRERKEKHLKDLEQKVEDLQKASESANHENSLLRAQVDRLQTELREYKRRLHASELTRTSSSLANMATGGFQFDFPPFGNFGKDNKDGFKVATTSSLLDRINSFSKQRTPSLTGSSNGINGSNYMSSIDGSMHGTPRLNGGRDTTSSPSASSVSQAGPGSSCGTSPEPSHGSPTSSKPAEGTITTAPNGDTYMCKSGSLDGETETTFCEKLGMACGNPHNPIPKVPQFSTTSDATTSSLDWLAQQSSGNTFDPVLFNDYRDPVNDINSTIGMSFFDDAFPAFDNLASSVAEPKKSGGLIDQIDALNNDDDEEEVVPADDPKQMLSCNKIWDRISSHPRFVSGELDMDGLCSELRSKAKCSEVGVVVAENDVQEVLGKVGIPHKDIM